MINSHEEEVSYTRTVMDSIECDICGIVYTDVDMFCETIQWNAESDVRQETSLVYEKIEEKDGKEIITKKSIHICPNCIEDAMKCISDNFAAKITTEREEC